MDDRLKLCFVLIVVAILCHFFGGYVVKVLDWLDGVETNSPFLSDETPYLYKGSGDGPESGSETGSEDDWDGKTIWGQEPCPGCGGIKNGKYCGYKQCDCPEMEVLGESGFSWPKDLLPPSLAWPDAKKFYDGWMHDHWANKLMEDMQNELDPPPPGR